MLRNRSTFERSLFTNKAKHAIITAPTWMDRSEYPFTGRNFAHPNGRIHYIDEGQGSIILFVHGTPDWSFGFRHLIKDLRSTHRCIAIDHLGFGLSDKPANADFTVAAHARRLQDFIDHLQLKDLTLVVTDFGGGIGLQHALEHLENVKRIVLYNTWMWSLNDDPRFAKPVKIARSWIGRMLYLHFGFSVNAMMLAGYGDKKKLTKSIHAHFKMALPNALACKTTYALANVDGCHSLLESAMGSYQPAVHHPDTSLLGLEGPLFSAGPVRALEQGTAACHRARLHGSRTFRTRGGAPGADRGYPSIPLHHAVMRYGHTDQPTLSFIEHPNDLAP